VALVVQDAAFYEVRHACPGFERGVQLDEGLRPEGAFLELSVDRLANPLVPDVDEAPDVLGIVADELVAKIEDIHVGELLLALAREATPAPP
jgi:hypothetical protein